MKNISTKLTAILFCTFIFGIFFSEKTFSAEVIPPQCVINEDERVNDPSFNPFGIHSMNPLGAQNTFDTGKPLDENRPRLCTLTGSNGNCPPSSLNAYTFTPNQGEDTQAWQATQAVGLNVSNNQNIYVPSSGYNLGGGAQVLVSNVNASAGTISLQYTLDAGFGGNRYDLHLSGIEISPEIVSAFSNREPGQLPALPAFYNLGKAKNNELIVAMADTGTFMNLLERNDFWIGDGNFTPAQLAAFYLEYFKCPQKPIIEAGPTCEKPLTAADSGTCIFGCSGTGVAIPNDNPFQWIGAILYGFFTQKYVIDVELASFVGSGNPYSNSEDKTNKPNLVASASGMDTKKIYTKDFWTNWGDKSEDKIIENQGKKPPKAINNLATMLTPEDATTNEVIEGFKSLDVPTKVTWYIENAAKLGGGSISGFVPNDAQLKALGVRILMPKNNCVGGCSIPTITYYPPGTNGTNPFGGGDHNIYTPDPNTYVTSIDGTVNSELAHTDNFPIYASGGYVVGGPDNYAPAINFGMVALDDTGTTTVGSQHTSWTVEYKKYTEAEALAYFNGLEYQGNKPQEEIVQEGGPIITAQKDIYPAYITNCAQTQAFFGTPEAILSTAIKEFPGINRQLFPKQIETVRLAYIENQKKEYLALNLSENEKYELQVEKLLGNGYANYLENKKKSENKLITNNKILGTSNKIENVVQKTASLGYDSNLICPYAKNSSTTKGCSPATSEKPETTIAVASNDVKVACDTEGNCPASGYNKDHRIFVKEDFVGTCQDIRSPDGVCLTLNPVQISNIKKDGSLYDTELPLNNCVINTQNSMLTSPLESKKDKETKLATMNSIDSKKKYSLVAKPSATTFFVNFNSDGEKEPMKKEMGSTPYICSGVFNKFTTSPEDLEEIKYNDKIAKECIPDTSIL